MALCCTHPARSRSPVQPIRLTNIDPIFTVTALPEDHPHAVHVQPPPAIDQTLIRSPSVVSKLKSHLQRKSTTKSLKSQLYDVDHEMLKSEDVLKHIENDETHRHGRSPSSSYSTDDMLAICTAFDGSAEIENNDEVKAEQQVVKPEAKTGQLDVDMGVSQQTVQQVVESAQKLSLPLPEERPARRSSTSRNLSVIHAEERSIGQRSVGRLSMSRALSISQPAANDSVFSSNDTSAVEHPVNKDLLTPEGQSFADYERKLSVCGDDRRWGASCDFQKYTEIQQDDKAAAGLMARIKRTSRAPSRASNTLMESALERQLQEKALFRSRSKTDDEAPSFVTTAWSGVSRHDEEADLGPLDVCTWDPDHPSCRRIQPKETSVSWSRWPSYDRGARAGPAGIGDEVRVRDFAISQPYTDRTSTTSPVVMKLKSVKRYYTDLLTTSGFHGKGHRTSIWSAGKLLNPDMEMLPPSLPTYTNQEPPHWVEGKSCSLPTSRQSSVPTSMPTAERASVPIGGQRSGERSSLSVDDKESADIQRKDRAHSPAGQSDGPAEHSSTPDKLASTRRTAQSPAEQSDGAGDMSAEHFSAMYSDCVSRPFSPVKITRYPSATVIDDRKGHWRSISLVSDKSFLRESSHDLLRLVEREKEKYERLTMS